MIKSSHDLLAAFVVPRWIIAVKDRLGHRVPRLDAGLVFGVVLHRTYVMSVYFTRSKVTILCDRIVSSRRSRGEIADGNLPEPSSQSAPPAPQSAILIACSTRLLRVLVSLHGHS